MCGRSPRHHIDGVNEQGASHEEGGDTLWGGAPPGHTADPPTKIVPGGVETGAGGADSEDGAPRSKGPGEPDRRTA